MNPPDQFEPPFRLGAWLVQPDLNRITGPQGQVQVEPRVMQVLLNLAARPGEVVTRNRLLDEVWGDLVVGEENLTRAISELRRIFQDQARRPAVIETIRHHGYRLIAPLQRDVSAAAAATDAPGGADEEVPPPANTPQRVTPAPDRSGSSRSRARGMPAVILATAVLAAAAAVLILRPLDGDGDRRPPVPAGGPLPASGSPVVPLTSYPGRERHPALSRDGTQVAFAWTGPAGTGQRGDTYIFVKQRNSETALQLTAQPGWAAWPTWSPDGQTVAFVQGHRDSATICTVPSLGGPVRPHYTAGSLIEGLDWSPDGTRLAFAALPGGGTRFALFTLSLDSLAVRPIGDPQDGGAGRAHPRFSPDGRRLAWIGTGPGGDFALYTGEVDGGRSRVVIRGMGDITGLAWSRDGSALICAAAPAGLSQLWRVPAAGGSPVLLPTGVDLAWNPTVARGNGDLVFEQVRVDQDLWRMTVKGQDPWRLESGPFAPSTRWEYAADFHPDGRRVVLVSARSGAPELWLGDSTGLNLQKLTAMVPAAITNPRWAPARDRIACNVLRDGRTEIAVLDARGGQPRILQSGLMRAVFCAWTADGQGLLVSAELGAEVRLFRVDPDNGQAASPAGGSRPVPVMDLQALTAAESADGRSLYFTRPDRPGLWRLRTPYRHLPPEGPELVLSDLQDRDRANWRLLDGRIAWVMRAGTTAILAVHDLDTGRNSLVADLPGLSGSSLAVSPDGMTILYARTGEVAADLMLMEALQLAD